MKRLAWLLVLVAAIPFAGCKAIPSGPEVVEPEVAGRVTDVTGVQGPIERWSLDTGLAVEYDATHDVAAYKNKLPAIGNLVLAGHMSRGKWIMQIGAGTLESPDDCYALLLPAFDRGESIEFAIGPSAVPNVPAGWRVRMQKAPGFRWQPGRAPRSDGTYIENTRFCIDTQGRVAGQPPN